METEKNFFFYSQEIARDVIKLFPWKYLKKWKLGIKFKQMFVVINSIKPILTNN